MRVVLVSGIAGLLLALGAGAAYASNPNVLTSSPYTIMGYDANGPTFVNPGHGDNPGYPPRFEIRRHGRGTRGFHRSRLPP